MNFRMILLVGLSFVILAFVFGVYVCVGTYIIPIAPYWVTQLPPNPPSPEIKYGEFEFELQYSFLEKTKKVSSIIMCQFDGFKVIAAGGPKKREWSENIKITKSIEPFDFKDEDRREKDKKYSAICIENIDKYKIVLCMPKAEWFLGELDYNGSPDMPDIQVYDTETKYYLEPAQRDVLLNEYNFEIINWICDKPKSNEFHEDLISVLWRWLVS